MKTGIAVALSLFVANLFGLESPFFSGVAAVITMQITVAESFLIGWNRMLGTIIGASFGMLASFWGLENPLAIACGIIMIIFILNKFHWNLSISIATIVFLSITILGGEGNPLAYSLNRILDTFVGITTGVLVNYFVFPPNLSKKIYNYSFLLIDAIVRVLDEMLCKNEEVDENVDIEGIRKKIDVLKRDYAIFKGELKLYFDREKSEFNTEKAILEFENIYQHLEMLYTMGGCHRIHEQNKEMLSQFINTNSYDGEIIEEEENTVYNYHLNKILVALLKLRRS
jgi:uncharacterized membrane protein YgaE (UPF0421/DUF939 family)